MATLEEIQTQIKEGQDRAKQIGQDITSFGDAKIVPSTAQDASPLSLGEINQDGAPSIDTTGALATAFADADGAVSTTITQDALDKEREEVLKGIEDTQKGLRTLLEDKPETVSEQEVSRQVFERLGLPEDFDATQFKALTEASARVGALKGEIDKLNALENVKLLSLEGQGGIAGIVNSQQRAVSRDFAIRKMGIAANMQVEIANLNAIQGKSDLVNNAINRAVEFATFAQEQAISDWEWMRDTYVDEFESLTDRERDLFDDRVKLLRDEKEASKKEFNDKMKAYADAGLQIPSTIVLGNMSIREVLNDVLAKAPTPVVEPARTDFEAQLSAAGLSNASIEDQNAFRALSPEERRSFIDRGGDFQEFLGEVRGTPAGEQRVATRIFTQAKDEFGFSKKQSEEQWRLDNKFPKDANLPASVQLALDEVYPPDAGGDVSFLDRILNQGLIGAFRKGELAFPKAK